MHQLKKEDTISDKKCEIKQIFAKNPLLKSLPEYEINRMLFFKKNKIIQSEKKSQPDKNENIENYDPNFKLNELKKHLQEIKERRFKKFKESYGECKSQFENDKIKSFNFREEKTQNSIQKKKIDFEKLPDPQINSSVLDKNNIDNLYFLEIQRQAIKDKNKSNIIDEELQKMDVEIDYIFQSNSLKNSKNFPPKKVLKLENNLKENERNKLLLLKQF